MAKKSKAPISFLSSSIVQKHLHISVSLTILPNNKQSNQPIYSPRRIRV